MTRTTKHRKPKHLLHALDQAGLGHIVRKHAKANHCTPKEVLGRRRLARIVAARHAVCRELREMRFSYPEIGEWMGIDHTTAMHACAKETT